MRFGFAFCPMMFSMSMSSTASGGPVTAWPLDRQDGGPKREHIAV
jgi:hypothetical protein